MKKQTKLFLWVGIIIATINILWMGYDAYQFQNFETWFTDPVNGRTYAYLVFYGVLFSLPSHLVVGSTIISSLKSSSKFEFTGAGILILGCFSFVFLFGDWAGLIDILHEYPQGFEVKSELTGLWFIMFIHFLFFFFSLIYLTVVKAANRDATSRSNENEQLFILLNSIGIVCGLIELMLVYVYFNVRRPLYKFEIVPFMIILIPYLSILIYWVKKSIKEKNSGWHDEKQKSDIRKSAIITLLASVTLMLLFFFINYEKVHATASILWLPFYFSVVLVVFSFSALYNYKVN